MKIYTVTIGDVSFAGNLFLQFCAHVPFFINKICLFPRVVVCIYALAVGKGLENEDGVWVVHKE